MAVHTSVGSLGMVITPPPPPCLGTAFRKNRPLVPRSNSRTPFFYCRIGFFVVLVDAGQLFRCAGQHFMCIAWFVVFGRSYLLLYPVTNPQAAHFLLGASQAWAKLHAGSCQQSADLSAPRKSGASLPGLGPGQQCSHGCGHHLHLPKAHSILRRIQLSFPKPPAPP